MCAPGWGGARCDRPLCENGCHQQGVCLPGLHPLRVRPGYGGADCSKRVCPNGCSSGGLCLANAVSHASTAAAAPTAHSGHAAVAALAAACASAAHAGVRRGTGAMYQRPTCPTLEHWHRVQRPRRVQGDDMRVRGRVGGYRLLTPRVPGRLRHLRRPGRLRGRLVRVRARLSRRAMRAQLPTWRQWKGVLGPRHLRRGCRCVSPQRHQRGQLQRFRQ